MNRSFGSFEGSNIYLDTMVFYDFLRANEPATKSLFRQIGLGNYQAFTSVLSFDELAYRLLLALIRDNHPG